LNLHGSYPASTSTQQHQKTICDDGELKRTQKDSAPEGAAPCEAGASLEELAARIVSRTRRGEPLDPRLVIELALRVLGRDDLTQLALDVVLGAADQEQDFVELAARVLSEALSDLGSDESSSSR
jgi:hypothetical protein